MTLSKNKLKYLTGFAKKKVREEEGKFIVEGNKLVDELLHSDFETECIVATADWLSSHTLPCECIEVSHDELAKLSLLQHPQDVWALAHCKERGRATATKGLYLALDGIQDPGNMGTIIRLADWFGIEGVFCSRDTVELYNPKVVQATMGAIFRVPVFSVDLPQFLKDASIPVFAADLSGENAYTTDLPHDGILVMGNEGNGISDAVAAVVNRTIHIPTFNTKGRTSESLNVAVATAILCSEFKRRTL